MTRTVIESKTKTVVIGFDEPFCVIGERINPTGRKKLAAELEAGDFSTVERDALEQVACGANVLDINSGAVFSNKMAEDPATPTTTSSNRLSCAIWSPACRALWTCRCASTVLCQMRFRRGWRWPRAAPCSTP